MSIIYPNGTLKYLYDLMGTYPDFPSKGVIFKDMLPLIESPNISGLLIALLANQIPDNVNCIVAPESRGFLLGILVAEKLHLPFIPLRKPNKLPGDKHTVIYKTEYSHDILEMTKGLATNKTCWFIDDIYATGGTHLAANELITKDGGQLIGGSVLLSVFDKHPDNIIELFREVK